MLQLSPWGKALSITFLFAKVTRLAWEEEEIQEGYLENPPAHFKSL